MKRLSYETQHYIIKLTESYSDIIELMVSTVTLVRKKETLLENRASFEGGGEITGCWVVETPSLMGWMEASWGSQINRKLKILKLNLILYMKQIYSIPNM